MNHTHLKIKSGETKEAKASMKGNDVPAFKEVYLWLKCQDGSQMPDENSRGCHLHVI